MNRPVVRKNQRQNCADCSWLDNRTEGLIKINPWTLFEATKNPATLIAFQSTIYLELVFEHPFATHNVAMRRSGNQIPGAVHQQSVVLLLHSTSPIGISKPPAIGARNGRKRRSSVDGREAQPTLRTCGHPVLIRHRLCRNSTTWKRSRRNWTIDRTPGVDMDELPQRPMGGSWRRGRDPGSRSRARCEDEWRR